MNEQRLIDLEIKISHQEATIEALQTSAYEQQKDINRLEKCLQRLTKQFESLARGDAEIGPANEPPPHY